MFLSIDQEEKVLRVLPNRVESQESTKIFLPDKFSMSIK